jgi:hypothetical protein
MIRAITGYVIQEPLPTLPHDPRSSAPSGAAADHLPATSGARRFVPRSLFTLLRTSGARLYPCHLMANALGKATAGMLKSRCAGVYYPADLLSLSPFLKLGEGIPRHPDQLGQFAAASNGFGGVTAMPQGVLISARSTASGRPAMHSTPALSVHRRRLARLPAPGPGSASACPVHR